MKAYAFVLTLAILVTHLGYDRISNLTGVNKMIVFYYLMGNLSAVLCSAIWLAVSEQKNSIWKLAVYLALGFGVAQGLMMNCIFFGPAPYGKNVCDYHANLPIGLTFDVLALFFSCWMFGKGLRNEQ